MEIAGKQAHRDFACSDSSAECENYDKSFLEIEEFAAGVGILVMRRLFSMIGQSSYNLRSFLY
jgi:hypothetical protein